MKYEQSMKYIVLSRYEDEPDRWQYEKAVGSPLEALAAVKELQGEGWLFQPRELYKVIVRGSMDYAP